jgi:hypothetical protein
MVLPQEYERGVVGFSRESSLFFHEASWVVNRSIDSWLPDRYSLFPPFPKTNVIDDAGGARENDR